ncbi:MAG: HTH domain-containing protein [Aliishimia sp.]
MAQTGVIPSKTDRLYALASVLQSGDIHRAEDLSERLGVSVRTIYRDVDALQSAGVPVTGTRGSGYRLASLTTLPPLSLPDAEMTALFLGLAIVAQAEDPALADAAQTLTDRLDAMIPAQAAPPSQDWKHAFSAHAQSARILVHLPTLRSAIKARQKLSILYKTGAEPSAHIIHPYETRNAGSLWTLRAWCETSGAEVEFRLDLIETAQALPELFTLL